MVEDRKIDYVNSKRLDKPLVALDIIREWRSQIPPGRFLKLDEKTKLYNDVGDKKAREKTSQALREKAPLIRKQQEEERMEHEHEAGTEDFTDQNKSTRFAEGTNPNDGGREDGISRAVLARDHSLGREYLKPDEAIDLGGFSWQDPFRNGSQRDGRTSSQGSFQSGSGGYYPPGPPPPGASPYRYPSHGSMGGPPPPPYPQMPANSEDRRFRYTNSGRYESWGSVGSVPPPPVPDYGYPEHSGGWGPGAPGRENSLGQNPLPHASIGHPAPPYAATFDSRGASGHWGPPPPGYPRAPYPGPPYYHYSGGPPPPGAYPPSREYSGGPPSEPPPPQQPRKVSSPSAATPKSPRSPPYEVDAAVASEWSSRKTAEIGKSWSGSSEERPTVHVPSDTRMSNSSPNRDNVNNGDLPKPEIVKRMTSHQNETLETKPDLKGPSVKRCALNRDQSAVANRLKQQYVPGYGGEEFDKNMRMLSADLEQSTLDSSPGGAAATAPTCTAKPTSLAEGGRTSTLDEIAMDLMVKPVSLNSTSRSSTIDALALEFDDEPLVQPEASDAAILGDAVENPDVGRPRALGFNDRLTTSDILDMVQEPIPADDLALVSGQRQSV